MARLRRIPKRTWALIKFAKGLSLYFVGRVWRRLGIYYFVTLVVALVLTYLESRRGELNPAFFGVAAQIVPVIALAFLVEARGIVANVVRGASAAWRAHEKMIEAMRKIEEAERNLVAINPSYVPEKQDIEGEERAWEADSQSWPRLISKVKFSTSRIVLVASTGELVALVSLAYGWTNPVALAFVLTNTVFAGLILVRITRLAIGSVELPHPINRPPRPSRRGSDFVPKSPSRSQRDR